MSTHPNVLLLLALTPDDLARKTYRAILQDAGVEDEGEMTRDVVVEGKDYHHMVMESDYDESWQISGREGQILLFDLVTYGYGERVTWAELEAQKAALEEWAKGICERHHCSYEISVGANYW